MRIAVVTVHDSANCGSFLQAYAIKDILSKDGHSVYFVRTRDEKYVRGLYYRFRLSREWVKHPLLCLKNLIYGIKKYKLYTREQECFETLDTFESDTDITILGSDEIWNIKTPVFNNPIFYGKSRKRAVALAVSAGLATPDDFSAKTELKDLIKNIDAPLVRDENTADCVEYITGIRPDMVCDPTIMADREIFFKDYTDEYLKKNKYVLLYAYEPTKAAQKAFREYADKHGLKLVSAGFSYSWCDYNVMASPLELSAVMKNAECVITTTFHGTIFATLNRKQFVCLPLGNKTTDVLKKFGLSQRRLDFSDLTVDSLESIMEEQIDYTAVDIKIEELKKKSLELLRDRINAVGGDLS